MYQLEPWYAATASSFKPGKEKFVQEEITAAPKVRSNFVSILFQL